MNDPIVKEQDVDVYRARCILQGGSFAAQHLLNGQQLVHQLLCRKACGQLHAAVQVSFLVIRTPGFRFKYGRTLLQVAGPVLYQRQSLLQVAFPVAHITAQT